MLKRKPVQAVMAVLAAVLLVFAGVGIAGAVESATVTVAAPGNLYGCITTPGRTIIHAYTTQQNFTASGGCPSGSFPFTVSSSAVTVTPTPTPTQTTPTPTPTPTTPTPTPTPTPTVTQTNLSTFSCVKTGLNTACGAYKDLADFPPSNGFDTYIENQDVGAGSGVSATLQSNGLPGSPQYVSTLTVPNNGGAVQIFTNIQQLFNDWNATANNWSGGSNTPISSLSALAVANAHTDPGDGGSGSQYEWAVDLWSSGYGSDVMFWTDTTAQRCQAGGFGTTNLGQLTLGGKPWTATVFGHGGEIILYEDGPSGTAGTCAQDTSGTVDVLGGLQWLQTHGNSVTGFPASGNDITQVNSGWEITQSSKGDQFTQNSMKYTATPVG